MRRKATKFTGRRLRAFEDATDINANLTVTIDYVGPIAHQTPDFGVVTQCVRRWEVMECRQLCQLERAGR
jgi:hypothetical protein